MRALATGFVVLIGWLYLVPQLQGAGLTLTTVTGAPSWVGAVVVGAVVTLNVAVGGMRSITFVQAFQYWVKLTAIAFPAMVLLAVWYHRDGAPGPAQQPLLDDGSRWLVPLTGLGEHPLFTDYSLILATFLGTMGLPHVLVRFYTNPDGRAARTTTLVVLGLLGVFYLFPTVYGALGRVYAPNLLREGNADAVVLVLPDAALGGLPGELLGGLVAAGAFAAFLSTASGLLVSVSGVLSTDLFGRWSGGHGSVRDFRRAAMVAGVVPLLLALRAGSLALSTVVGLAFAVAASTFCPLLVLGIWWRRLTPIGAGAGLIVGGGLSGAAVLITVLGTEAVRLARGAARRAGGLDACRSRSRSWCSGRWPARSGCRPTWAGRWCSCTHPNGSASSGDRCRATVIVVTSAQPARHSAHLPPRDPTASPSLSYGRVTSCRRRRRRRCSVTSSETAPSRRGRTHPRGVLPDGRRPKIRRTCARRFRNFVFPMTVAFLTWYLLYVVLSAFGRGFMDTKVVGNLNVAFFFGLLAVRHHVPHRLGLLEVRRQADRSRGA